MAARLTEPYRNRQRQANQTARDNQNVRSFREPPPSYKPITTPRTIPQNDNVPPPANDNQPITNIPNELDKARKVIRTARRLTRTTFRRTPWGRYWDLADFIIDTSQLIQIREKDEILDLKGQWCIKRTCPDDIYNASRSLWIYGPGQPCTIQGTVCANQGGVQYSMPVYPGNGFWPSGVVIGGLNTFVGGLRPKWWLAWKGTKKVSPNINEGWHVWTRGGTPPFRDPWFLPIDGFVQQPTRSPPVGDTQRSPPTPDGSTQSQPSSITPTRPVAPPTPPSPPRPNEKERKTRVQKGLAKLLEIAFEATEAVDFIDIAWENIPKQYRAEFLRNRKRQGKPLTPQEKFAAVYRYSDKIDMNGLFLDLLKNQAIDWAVGNASKRSDQFLRDAGVTVYGGGNAF